MPNPWIWATRNASEAVAILAAVCIGVGLFNAHRLGWFSKWKRAAGETWKKGGATRAAILCGALLPIVVVLLLLLK